MAGGRATIVTMVDKGLLGDAAEDVARTASRDGVKTATKDVGRDATETAGRDAVKDGSESAARDSGRPLKDGEPGREPGARTETKDPIDVATGEVLFAGTDLSLPGVLPLVFERMHLSSYRQGGLYGVSWATTLDQRLEVTSDSIIYGAPDGTILTYP